MEERSQEDHWSPLSSRREPGSLWDSRSGPCACKSRAKQAGCEPIRDRCVRTTREPIKERPLVQLWPRSGWEGIWKGWGSDMGTTLLSNWTLFRSCLCGYPTQGCTPIALANQFACACACCSSAQESQRSQKRRADQRSSSSCGGWCCNLRCLILHACRALVSLFEGTRALVHAIAGVEKTAHRTSTVSAQHSLTSAIDDSFWCHRACSCTWALARPTKAGLKTLLKRINEFLLNHSCCSNPHLHTCTGKHAMPIGPLTLDLRHSGRHWNCHLN